VVLVGPELDADPALAEDIESAMERIVDDKGGWRHSDADGPNAPAHEPPICPGRRSPGLRISSADKNSSLKYFWRRPMQARSVSG